MTKTLSKLSHKKFNLNANEGFVMFLTSRLITCFIDTFTSKRKSQSIAYLLHGSEQIYWIMDLEDEVHSIWVIWQATFKNARVKPGSGLSRVRACHAQGTKALAFSVLPLPAAMTSATLVTGKWEPNHPLIKIPEQEEPSRLVAKRGQLSLKIVKVAHRKHLTSAPITNKFGLGIGMVFCTSKFHVLQRVAPMSHANINDIMSGQFLLWMGLGIFPYMLAIAIQSNLDNVTLVNRTPWEFSHIC